MESGDCPSPSLPLLHAQWPAHTPGVGRREARFGRRAPGVGRREAGVISENAASFDAVIFDFYGTVAEHDGTGVSLATLLAARGYHLPDELARYYWQDGIDGKEHVEHSCCRDHYLAWRRDWLHL